MTKEETNEVFMIAIYRLKTGSMYQAMNRKYQDAVSDCFTEAEGRTHYMGVSNSKSKKLHEIPIKADADTTRLLVMELSSVLTDMGYKRPHRLAMSLVNQL